MALTMKDIAQKANVSIATVSRYIHQNGYVSPKTQERLKEVLSETNFKPKQYRSRKKRQKQNEIGVIIAEQNMFFSDIVYAVQDIAYKNGNAVFVCNSQERNDIEIMNLEAMHYHVGGLIITPISQIHSYNEEFLIEINKSGIPVILVDRDISSGQMDAVFSDSYSGAYDGVNALIKEGHRRIGMLAGSTTSKPGLDRLNGYLQALKDADIEVREEFILYGDFSYDKSYLAVKRMLKKELPVTAMFSSNYQMTLGCLKAFEEQKIAIPGDVSFLSFDDYPLFASSLYNMSVVVNPGYQMGEEAANILFSRMNDIKKGKRSYIRRTVLTPYVKLRGSEKFMCRPKP